LPSLRLRSRSSLESFMDEFAVERAAQEILFPLGDVLLGETIVDLANAADSKVLGRLAGRPIIDELAARQHQDEVTLVHVIDIVGDTAERPPLVGQPPE